MADGFALVCAVALVVVPCEGTTIHAKLDWLNQIRVVTRNILVSSKASGVEHESDIKLTIYDTLLLNIHHYI